MVKTISCVPVVRSGTHSLLLIVTGDRPGLLTDAVRVMKDLNLNVVSAEVGI